MTPEAMKAAQKMISDAYDDGYITVTPVWVGQLDGCDVFDLRRNIPVDDDAEGPILLGWPEYAFVDPKQPDKFLYKNDDDLDITNRLEEAEAKAKSKAKH